MENNKGRNIVAHFYGHVDEKNILLFLPLLSSNAHEIGHSGKKKRERETKQHVSRHVKVQAHQFSSLQSSPSCKEPATETTLLLALTQETLKAFFPCSYEVLTSLLEFEDKKNVLIHMLIIEIRTANKYFGKLQVASKRGTFHFKPKV